MISWTASGGGRRRWGTIQLSCIYVERQDGLLVGFLTCMVRFGLTREELRTHTRGSADWSSTAASDRATGENCFTCPVSDKDMSECLDQPCFGVLVEVQVCLRENAGAQLAGCCGFTFEGWDSVHSGPTGLPYCWPLEWFLTIRTHWDVCYPSHVEKHPVPPNS